MVTGSDRAEGMSSRGMDGALLPPCCSLQRHEHRPVFRTTRQRMPDATTGVVSPSFVASRAPAPCDATLTTPNAVMNVKTA
ncbi:UNVERIFIED_ORG: hypothetical protein ABIB63_001200 [Xanthomonas axonopodis]